MRVLLLILLSCAACGPLTTPATAVPTPVPLVLSVRTPQPPMLTLSGTGDKDTDPFTLAAGDYAATWSASNSTPSARCYFTANLHHTRDAARQTTLTDTTVAAPRQQGSGHAYAVPADRYYVRVSTSCDSWAITLAPQP